jgi:hypothetical protein
LKSFDLKTIGSAAETYLAIAGASVAAAVFVASNSYPEIDWTLGGPPAYYPRLLALLLAVLSVAVFAEGLVRPKTVQRPPRKIVARMAAGLTILSLAPVGIGVLGFLFAGVIISFALMVLLADWEGGKLKQLTNLLLSSVGCTVVLFVIFRYVAGVRLPAGVLFG